METTVQNKSKSFTGIKSAGLVILACLVIAILIFHLSAINTHCLNY